MDWLMIRYHFICLFVFLASAISQSMSEHFKFQKISHITMQRSRLLLQSSIGSTIGKRRQRPKSRFSIAQNYAKMVPARLQLQAMNRSSFPEMIKYSLPTSIDDDSTTESISQLRPEVQLALQRFLSSTSSHGQSDHSSSSEVTPTLVQSMAAKPILEGRNVFLAAETGSGKTLAYMAPIMSLLRSEEQDHGVLRLNRRPRCLILVPSKELCLQTASVAKQLSRDAKLRCEAVLDRVSKHKGEYDGMVDVVVSTPQKFLYQLEHGVFSVTDLRYLVVDEADTMLQKDFGPLVKDILFRIRTGKKQPNKDKTKNPFRKDLPAAENTTIPNISDDSFSEFNTGIGIKRNLQCIFVSATVPKTLAPGTSSRDLPQDMVHIVTPRIHSPSPLLKQRFINISGDGSTRQKVLMKVLFELPPKDEPAIVFCNKLGGVKSLLSWMTSVPELLDCVGGKDKIGMLSSNQTSEERHRVLQQFQNGEFSMLVCTDVASRGLDTTRARHVILYDFPVTAVDYLHRVGRTARAGLGGRATSIVGKRDQALADFIQKSLRSNKNLSTPSP